MSEEEKVEFIELILGDDKTIQFIKNRYYQYKREGVYFYVPVTVNYMEDSLKLDIGDKSYSNIEELKDAVEALFEDKIKDSSYFVDLLWDNKEKNINVLLLIETEEYSFATFVTIPV